MNIVPGTNFVISKVTFANTGGFRAGFAFAEFGAENATGSMPARPINKRVLKPPT